MNDERETSTKQSHKHRLHTYRTFNPITNTHATHIQKFNHLESIGEAVVQRDSSDILLKGKQTNSWVVVQRDSDEATQK